MNIISSAGLRSERNSAAYPTTAASAQQPPVFTRAHTLSILQRLKMMKDAISGVAFLHSRGYLHCDIKSLNFLVDEVRVQVSFMIGCLAELSVR